MTIEQADAPGRPAFVVGIPCTNEPPDLLAETLRAIARSTLPPSRVLIVDNGDGAFPWGALALLDPIPSSVIHPGENLGCAGSWNLIHQIASPASTILLNADCAVAPDTFARMMASAAPVVLGYGFGCTRIDDEIWRSVGAFDEAFYPVYFEDTDYRRRLRLAGIPVEEWPTDPVAVVAPGRERAQSGIVHGKHDPDGYQGWRGDKLAWFHARVEANRAHYRTKWGGDPGSETRTVPLTVPLDRGDAGAADRIARGQVTRAGSVIRSLLSSGALVHPGSASEPAPTPRTPRVIPAYDVGTDVACRPLGLPMCQNRLAVPTWSYAMERYPPARIVEIGTYSGALAVALGVHAMQIGARVIAYDVSRAPDERIAALASVLPIEFRCADVWTREAEIGQLIAQPGVTYVLCDGGDKRRELATFARYCKPGDVIAAHDYHAPGSQGAWWGWSEIRDEDGAAVAEACDLVPWMQEHFDAAAWLAYRRRTWTPVSPERTVEIFDGVLRRIVGDRDDDRK